VLCAQYFGRQSRDSNFNLRVSTPRETLHFDRVRRK
jgi:hypothetical protein